MADRVCAPPRSGQRSATVPSGSVAAPVRRVPALFRFIVSVLLWLGAAFSDGPPTRERNDLAIKKSLSGRRGKSASWRTPPSRPSAPRGQRPSDGGKSSVFFVLFGKVGGIIHVGLRGGVHVDMGGHLVREVPHVRNFAPSGRAVEGAPPARPLNCIDAARHHDLAVLSREHLGENCLDHFGAWVRRSSSSGAPSPRPCPLGPGVKANGRAWLAIRMSTCPTPAPPGPRRRRAV